MTKQRAKVKSSSARSAGTSDTSMGETSGFPLRKSAATAPSAPPAVCAATYGAISPEPIFPLIHTATVTAGL